MKSLKTFGVVGLAFFAVMAQAQVTFTNAGPSNSDGPVGDAGNGIFAGVGTGTAGIYGSITMAGNLTTGGVGSWESEARWSITVGANTTVYQPSLNTATWVGTTAVSRSVGGMYWATPSAFSWETFESFNDAGLDATWDTMSLSYSGAVSVIDAGSFLSGTDFTFDTEGSDFDTEIGLFMADGTLLGNDDDGGTGALSLLASGVLADGEYYLVGSGFNTLFSNGAVSGGAAAGNLLMNLNGSNVFTGAHAASTVSVVKFTVDAVPEPASMTILGGAALIAAARRRRKK